MMFYLVPKTRPDISFSVNKCDRFTYNTEASHYMDMKRISCYLQGTKDNVLVFNPSKKLVLNFYAGAYFAGLCVHENPQDPICNRSRTVFVVMSSNCPILCM